MNRWLVCLIVSALLCLAAWTAHAELTRNTAGAGSSPPPQTWEYEGFEDHASTATVTKLNQRGAQGWELITTVCARGTDPCWFYMKRAR